MDIAKFFVDIPLIKIIEPMAWQAAKTSDHIGVLGTLASAIGPTINLINEKVRAAGKKADITTGLCDEAFQALISGQKEKHDELLKKAAQTMALNVGVIVLAQGSMAGMADELCIQTGIPVLSCLRSGVRGAADLLGQTLAGGT
jgi:Asp/Glu/hydantoin racemase